MGSAAAAADVRVSLMGGFGATIDGEPVSDRWRLRKARTLVKLLALAPAHRMHRDALVDVLWPGSDPAAATNNLHQAVHAARQVLGPTRLVLTDEVLSLCPEDCLTVDAEAFERAAAEARAAGDVALLRRALALWTGTLLPEDEYEPWTTAARDRLCGVRDALTAQLAGLLARDGEPEAALALLEPIVGERPLDEPLHRALIEALSALGRRWDAIAAYERLREALESEYAAEPAPETKALYRALLTGSTAPTGTPHNLPEPATSFVGRHRTLDELGAGLERTRLLTLSGPGGAGKSRLALELGHRSAMLTHFPDGIWWVELAGVKDRELVGSTTAAALRVALPTGHSSAQAVADQLSARTLMLVLDNCEHVLDATCELVGEVLARCPGVTVLTTSREPLGIPGEIVHRVPSLEVPVADAAPDVDQLSRLEAVQLFVERARHTVPTFGLVPETAEAVARICRRLDGMPLALELAAARLAHLSVNELADRLSDALSLLARRGGAGLDRQQTLAATLDWSHDLLESDEQVAFRRLAVFSGGFDLDAATHVCDSDRPTIDLVSRLVDKSLVEADTSGPSARYRMLEVVRQYADARLVESEDAGSTRARHREWFASTAAAHDPDKAGPVVGEPSAWFDVEQDNLRAALSSALVEDPPLALALATSTWRFWLNRGLIGEGARWLGLVLERCPEQSALRAHALAAASVLHIRQGRMSDLEAIGEQIVDLMREHGEPAELAQGRHYRALLTFMSGDWARAADFGFEAIAEAAGVPAVRASGQHLAGIMALSRGHLEQARAWFEHALESLAATPDGTPPYFAGMNLGWVVDARADLPMPYGEETLLLGRRLGTQQAVGHVTIALALTERLAGDLDQAFRLIERAAETFDALGDRYGQAYAAAQRGHALRWIGDHAEADRALARAESLRRNLRDHRSVALTLAGRSVVAAAAGDSGPAIARGREALRMMERSGDTAGVNLTAVDLAISHLLLDDLEGALEWVKHGLAFSDVPGGDRGHAWTCLFQAHLLARAGQPDAASAAAAEARTKFAALREESGLAAVQSACKAGALTLPQKDPTRRSHDTRTG